MPGAVALPVPDPGFSLAQTSPNAQSDLPASSPTAADQRLAFVSNGDLFTIQTDGSNRQRVGDFATDSYVSALTWSPDGRQLAAVYNFGTVYDITPGTPVGPPLFTSDCGQPPTLSLTWRLNLAALLIQQRCPADRQTNSPDRLDVFESNGMGAMRSLSAFPRNITSDLYLSPDGNRVAYVFNQHIYVMALEGGVPRKITAVPGDYSSAGSPLAWSPDGTQIAFFAGTYPNQQLNLINTDGSDRRVLTPDNNFQIYRSRLLWSPNGRYIALYVPYNSPYSNQETVSLVDVETDDLKPLTRPGFYNALGWSPDSRTLTFAAGNQFATQTLFALSIADQTFQSLTSEPVQQILDAAWSPDGAWVAYTAMPSNNEELGNQRLYVVRPDGTGLKALTGADEYAFPFAWQP